MTYSTFPSKYKLRTSYSYPTTTSHIRIPMDAMYRRAIASSKRRNREADISNLIKFNVAPRRLELGCLIARIRHRSKLNAGEKTGFQLKKTPLWWKSGRWKRIPQKSLREKKFSTNSHDLNSHLLLLQLNSIRQHPQASGFQTKSLSLMIPFPPPAQTALTNSCAKTSMVRISMVRISMIGIISMIGKVLLVVTCSPAFLCLRVIRKMILAVIYNPSFLCCGTFLVDSVWYNWGNFGVITAISSRGIGTIVGEWWRCTSVLWCREQSVRNCFDEQQELKYCTLYQVRNVSSKLMIGVSYSRFYSSMHTHPWLFGHLGINQIVWLAMYL